MSGWYSETYYVFCRPFIVQPVGGSNMILLVINNICLNKEQNIRYPYPERVNEEKYYNMSLTCYRVLHNLHPRRHYMSCINRNIHVSISFHTGLRILLVMV